MSNLYPENFSVPRFTSFESKSLRANEFSSENSYFRLLNKIMIESADQFVLLRTSENIELYQQAANESATDKVWQEVISKYPDMRVWVARNKTVPISILEVLSHDENAEVRHAVAMKRKSGQDILQRLAHDPDESVRLRVALNPKTPKVVLEELLNDSWSRVVEEAKIRLEEDFTV